MSKSDRSQKQDSDAATSKGRKFLTAAATFLAGSMLPLVGLLFGSNLLGRPSVQLTAQSIDLSPPSHQTVLYYSLIMSFLDEPTKGALDVRLRDTLKTMGVAAAEIAEIKKASNHEGILDYTKLKPHQVRLVSLALSQTQSEWQKHSLEVLKSSIMPTGGVLIIRADNTGRSDAEEFILLGKANAYIQEVVVQTGNEVTSREFEGQDFTIKLSRLSPGADCLVVVWLKALSEEGTDSPIEVNASWKNGYSRVPVTLLGPLPGR